MKARKLYLISNRKLVKRDTFYDVIQGAVEGGVDAIILREKDLPYKYLMPMAFKIREIVKDTNVSLIVHSNWQAAADSGADGLHIGFSDFMKKEHAFKGEIGVSIHSVKEAVLAQENGASYLLAGHIFKTDCKKDLEPRGLGLLRKIKPLVNIPLIALGGICPLNAEKALDAGAHGVAVMSYIMASENPYKAALDLKEAIIKRGLTRPRM